LSFVHSVRRTSAISTRLASFIRRFSWMTVGDKKKPKSEGCVVRELVGRMYEGESDERVWKGLHEDLAWRRRDGKGGKRAMGNMDMVL
jgi:hypothetical protein